ncbi:hypothetical protein BC826DRAFT_257473 [Russula brevipes]|nr:hypothetical protein BC826DRAFT_257473 [Russula brevipes]
MKRKGSEWPFNLLVLMKARQTRRTKRAGPALACQQEALSYSACTPWVRRPRPLVVFRQAKGSVQIRVSTSVRGISGEMRNWKRVRPQPTANNQPFLPPPHREDGSGQEVTSAVLVSYARRFRVSMVQSPSLIQMGVFRRNQRLLCPMSAFGTGAHRRTRTHVERFTVTHQTNGARSPKMLSRNGVNSLSQPPYDAPTFLFSAPPNSTSGDRVIAISMRGPLRDSGWPSKERQRSAHAHENDANKRNRLKSITGNLNMAHVDSGPLHGQALLQGHGAMALQGTYWHVTSGWMGHAQQHVSLNDVITSFRGGRKGGRFLGRWDIQVTRASSSSPTRQGGM